MRSRFARAVVAATCAALAAGMGCAGPATFVSADPPPDVDAEAWYASAMPAVRSALERAMIDAGMIVDRDASSQTKIVASKQQMPHIGEGTDEPAAGPLPVYRLTAELSRPGDTHVLATLVVRCAACNGETAYQWEYPGDVVRRVFEETRKILKERSPRYRYPPRFVAPPWRPPRRR